MAENLLVSGNNSYGQLGNGQSDYYPEFVEIAENVVSVSAGSEHVLFQDTAGRVWLLGLNQVGPTDDAPDLVFGQAYGEPVLIANNVEYYEATEDRSFFRFEGDDQLYSTGFASRGVDGLSGFLPRTSPTLVAGVDNIIDTSSTYQAALYLDIDGDLYGSGNAFNLGLGFVSDPETPVLLEQGILDVEQGINYPTFLHSSGELRRYKFGGGYEVIDSDVTDFSLAGVSLIYYIDISSRLYSRSSASDPKVQHSDNARSVISEEGTMFFTTNDDQLWALGKNSTGLMGKGDFEEVDSAIFIRDDVKKMAMNQETLYIIDSNGTLLAAGHNTSSMLGRSLADSSRSPVLLTSGPIARVEAGHQNVYYVAENGDLFGFGRNDVGQLGLGDTNHRNEPELIASSVIQVSVSEATSSAGSHAVFTNASGELWGMGTNHLDQTAAGGGTFTSPQLIDTDVVMALTDASGVAYLKQDHTLWIRGATRPDSDGEDVQMVTNDAVKFDIGAILFYIDSEGELKTKNSGFISTYKNENGIDYAEEIEELTIDTNVVELAAGWSAVAYINEDGALHVSGSRSFLGGGYVVEPLLIDTDVVKLSFSRSALMYQKSDSSVWLIAESLDFYPPEFEDIPDDPIQVFADLSIKDFSVGETNIAYLTESTEPPSVVSTYLSMDGTLSVGQPVTLNAEVSGDYSDFTWFAGELGDRTNPIEDLSTLTVDMFPYLSTTYWVEVSNPYGTAQSPEAIRVEVDFPEYGEWALGEGLQGAEGEYTRDPDLDGNANLLEFAYGTRPKIPDSLSIFDIETAMNGSVATLVVSKPNAEGIVVSLLAKEGAQSGWQDISQIESAQSEETDDSYKVTLPADSTTTELLLRLHVAPD